MKRYLILALKLFYFVVNSNAQQAKEYFVSVDPLTGNYTIISELPGVLWIKVAPGYSTFDSNNGRYFFVGADNSQSIFRLYSVDCITGNILSNPVIPQITATASGLGRLLYSQAASTIYGLDANGNSYQLVSLDPLTGSTTNIGIPISNCYIYAKTEFINENTNEFCVIGREFGQTDFTLYKINMTTGNIISVLTQASLPSTEEVTCAVFNNNNSVLTLVLQQSFTMLVHNIVTLNINTGVIDTLFTDNGECPDEYSSANYSLYQNLNQFTFTKSIGPAGFWDSLMTFDLNTNQMISNPPFNWSDNSLDSNLIELEYNQSSGLLYGLHWGTHLLSGIHNIEFGEYANLFPNPFIEELWISNITYKKNTPNRIRILNLLGEEIMRVTTTDASVKLNTVNLKAGVYTVLVNGLMKKVVKLP